MQSPARILLIIGVVSIIASIVVGVGSRLHLGRLPGDIIIKRDNFTFYFPIMTGIIISVVLSIIFRLYHFFTR